MPTLRWLVPLIVLLPALAGCGSDETVVAPVSGIAVVPGSGGRFDVAAGAGRTLLRGAWAEALIDDAGTQRTLSTRDCKGSWHRIDASPKPGGYFDALRGHELDCAIDGVGLALRVYADPVHNAAIATLDVSNHRDQTLSVLRFTPVISSGDGGGLFVGKDALRTRVLDDGMDIVADTEANLHYPDESSRQPIVDSFFEIKSRGDVLSNWNHAVVDLDSGQSWIAGSLGVERAFPTFGTTLDPDAPATAPGGRTGQDEFVADQALLYHGKPVQPGATLSSEVVYMNPSAPDPWTGLEDYADAMAAWLAVVPWTKRDGGRPTPNGWNSWSGSGSTGGLGTNIDETNMSENLAVMAREFKPYGIDYFQMDDGYQTADGDWLANDKFPSGMPAFSKKVSDAGLLPGLWIAAFRVSTGSVLAAEHPDWLLDPDTNVLHKLFDPGASARMLDLSNPAVRDWLAATMKRYKDDWGQRWIKHDFGYYDMLFPPKHDPTMTSVEAYKSGVRAIKAALGDDVFYLGIALMGINFGVVDGMRLTLDSGPLWEESQPFSLTGSGNSFKATAKTGARRYYFQNRLWVTHNDLLFFRTDKQHPDPPVTMDEAKTYSAFMSLSGSIIKFGEDLRTLTPEQITVWRQLLPSYPDAARPMDLFTRHYPEEWLLRVHGTLAGSDAGWAVVGLLNWGRNFDFTQRPIGEMPDEARDYTVDLAKWGLDPDKQYLASEFWSEAFLGLVQGTLERTVPAHHSEVIALREATGHPQFLGDNRQITQGATDLESESWNEGARRLDLRFKVDAGSPDAVPFEYRFRVYAPEGYDLASADGADASQDGRVITLRITPDKSGDLALAVQFK